MSSIEQEKYATPLGGGRRTTVRMGQPLRGLRVLDLSRVLAGPWCSMLLGDAGANVIKLERTKQGDDTRSWGPPFLNHQVSTYFLSVNRNKKSLAVNLQHDQGRDICFRLATEWADVVIENFKVGTLERYDLGYDTLSKRNPRLIYCSVTGFGPAGPLSNRPGYDVVISGMYGLMSITGDEHGNPAKVGVAITDVLTGTLAYGGIVSALHERDRTGVGQRVDVSLMETQLASLVNIASSALNSPPNTPPPKRWGTAHESIVPYQTFSCQPTTGGEHQYIVVGAGNDEQFKKLCHVLGLSELASDERFFTNSSRVAHRDELIALLQAKFLEQPRDAWVSLLDGKGFPMGPVRTVPEAFACEQAKARNMVEEWDHPVAGRVKLPRSPIMYSSINIDNDSQHLDQYEMAVACQKLPPPMLGEHTEELLQEILKFQSPHIRHLERQGVIECWRHPSGGTSTSKL